MTSLLGVYISALSEWIDTNVVDGIANGISVASQSFSRFVRRIQTGITQQYIFVFALGVAALLIFLILASGGSG